MDVVIAAFFTGLLTGGLTCMAVQGSLLGTLLVAQEASGTWQDVRKKNIVVVSTFLVAKLLVYTLLGGLLGWAGTLFQLSFVAQALLTALIALFMLGLAGNMLNLHPLFRYFVIQPPKFLTRLVRSEAKSQSLIAPALLGVFTVFIPCGSTQAMLAQTVTSGSPVTGALLMAAFIVGTSPLFFVLGLGITAAKGALSQQFQRLAAGVLIIMGLVNLNNALALTGTSWTFEQAGKTVLCAISFCGEKAVAGTTVQQSGSTESTITFYAHNYATSAKALKAGAAITLTLANKEGAGCIQAFTIPSLGIQKLVRLGQSETVTFTAPDKPGKLAFMCSMGMYRGEFEVVKG